MTREDLDALAKRVLQAAFRVHTAFGPGLLESAYTACLVFELNQLGLQVRTEVPVPVVYQGVKLTDVGKKSTSWWRTNWCWRSKPLKRSLPFICPVGLLSETVGQTIRFAVELQCRQL